MKGRPGRVVLVCAAALAVCAQAARAEVTITARPGVERVEVGDTLVIEIQARADARDLSDPTLGELEHFELVSNPCSTSTSMQMVLGQQPKTTVQKTCRYELVALREGTELFNEITVQAGGRTARASAFSVTVLPRVGGEPRQEAGWPPPFGQSETARSRLGRDNFFVDVVLDKPEAYVGETVRASFVLYSIYDVYRWDGSAIGANFFQGVQQDEIPLPQGRQAAQLARGNLRYLAYEMRRALLFPIRAGELRVEPQDVTVWVQRVIRDWPFSRRETVPESVRSNPVVLRVKELPRQGQPAGFDGAVGRFDVKAEVDNGTPAVGGGFLLRLTVWGEGNFHRLKAPDLPDLPGFRRSREFSTFDTKPTENGLMGAAVFDYALSPLVEGATTIPPITLAFFDPVAGQYESRSTAPIPITVQPRQVDNAGGIVFSRGVEQIQVDPEAIDFRHIAARLEGGLRQGRPLYGGGPFWAGVLLPALVLVGSVMALHERRRLETDAAYARRRRAGRTARKRLAEARAAQAEGDAATFYGAVARAILGLIRDRLHVAALGMTREQLRETLAARKVDGGLVDRTLAFLAETDRFRFAGEGAETREEILREAETLIRGWERVR